MPAPAYLPGIHPAFLTLSSCLLNITGSDYCAFCCSVLIHLLPGLALFAHRYAPVPEVVGHTWRRMFGGAGRTDLTAQKPPEFFWVFGAPLIFYVVWQLMYFLIVQVGCICTP